ncbi:MAG: hypothetical protein ACOCV2_12645 [Persicimonas sp.]
MSRSRPVVPMRLSEKRAVPFLSTVIVVAFLLTGLTACSSCEDESFGDADAGDVGARDADDARYAGDASDADDARTDDADDADHTGDVGDAGRMDASDADAASDASDASSDGGADDAGDGADAADAVGDAERDRQDASDGGGDDAGDDAGSPPSGLSEPCQNGSGWTVFRFHYDNNSTSAQIDVWDASCSYSLASNSACNVREVTSGFGDIDRTSDGYPLVTSSSDYIRVRYSVENLSFSEAEVHLQGRSYSTSSSTDFEISSPLYGSRTGGPVDNDFTYDWYSLDWTGYVDPSDDPDMTAVEIYSTGGELAVQAFELCVE